MKTKISLMLLSLGLVSGAAYAGAVAEPMPVSNDINVTAPDQSGMWSFGATAVLLQPVGNTLNYADVVTATSTDFKTVDQSYHWWFGADVTYAFPGNGRDVTLAYEGFNGSDSNSVASDVEAISGKVESRYDAADLVFGQKLDVGQRVRLHPFAGLRYGYIDVKNTLDSTTSDTTGLVLGSSAKQEGTFSGIGPRFGTDAQVNLGQGFSIRGRLGLSALIGSSDPTLDTTTTNYTVSPNTTTPDSFNHDSSTRVVPEMDGRLGLNYTFDFNSGMAMGVEAGWEATNYFNAVAQEAIDANGNASASVDHSNFALQGPYARVQLDIA